MAKFNVNDDVIINESGKKGVILYRDETRDKENERTTVRYFVKFGNGTENYAWFNRKEISKPLRIFEEGNNKRIKTRMYDMSNGYKLTLVAIVENIDGYDETSITYFEKERVLRIGYSLCNPLDEYDENIGYKLAKHRAYEKPFTHMVARFTGEFNEETTKAIMDVKAKYICENIDNFINS